MARLGISALLSVVDSVDSNGLIASDNNELCQINITVADSSTADIGRCFPQTIDFIESVRESGGKVLVHCLAGISRSATICIAYLMYSGRMNLDQAHDYLKQCRPLISPNLNFMQQLAQFETQLFASPHHTTTTTSTSAAAAAADAVLFKGPSSDLMSSVLHHCACTVKHDSLDMKRKLSSPVVTLTGVNCHSSVSHPGNSMSSCRADIVRHKRPLAIDLVLSCNAELPTKICRMSSSALQLPPTPCSKQVFASLQPPPTPCTKQVFAFDLQTVMMMAGRSSPSICHSPIASPS
jgi:hypothetical protein